VRVVVRYVGVQIHLPAPSQAPPVIRLRRNPPHRARPMPPPCGHRRPRAPNPPPRSQHEACLRRNGERDKNTPYK